MKMVAASKMRNAQVAVENSRGIVAPFVRLFGDYPGAARRRRRTLHARGGAAVQRDARFVRCA
jgi:F-type H+-transporting ATPase subunit gamma